MERGKREGQRGRADKKRQEREEWRKREGGREDRERLEWHTNTKNLRSCMAVIAHCSILRTLKY